MSVFQRVHMPSLGGATGWLNSEPLGPAELRGHVVLVNFWTLTCINWLRQRYRPNVRDIHCFVFGYEKDTTFTPSLDVELKTFSELINALRDEYREYAEVLEAQRTDEPPPLDDAPSTEPDDGIPF